MEDARPIFSSPLILGASISAGHGTRDGGLGAVLSRQVNPHAQITNIAKSGATSVKSTTGLNFDSFSPSVMLGLDLFFWDAVMGQVDQRFEVNTQRIFDSFHRRSIPMIIGMVPVLDLPFLPRLDHIKRNAEKVNKLLAKMLVGKNAVLYDPLTCYSGMETSHFMDGLHLNEAGNLYCAKYFLKSQAHRTLKSPPSPTIFL